jgi:type IV secretory pathway VirB10-like protein
MAQVTDDVFNSTTGQTRLIPQGARLLGTHDSKDAFGQDRALVIWNRLVYPDGRSVDLDQMSTADGSGAAGLADRVDNHWGRFIKAGIVATLFRIKTELSDGSGDGAIAEAIRDSNGQTVGRAGHRLVERELKLRPTIFIRRSARIRVLINRDLVLAL